MASVLLSVVDALVDTLNAATWSGPDFVARRAFADVFDEELQGQDADAIQVDVIVPEAYDDVTLDTRAAIKRTVTIDIVIRRKFAPEHYDAATNEIDADKLAELVELGEILSLEATYARMTASTEAAWQSSEHDPIYRKDHLRQLRQFTGVVAITFEIYSAL